MNARTRHILKHPGYMGTIQELMPFKIRKPSLSEITFTKVPKTEVTCTHCWGMKAQVVPMYGHVIKTKCPICNGTGKMEIDHTENRKYGL